MRNARFMIIALVVGACNNSAERGSGDTDDGGKRDVDPALCRAFDDQWKTCVEDFGSAAPCAIGGERRVEMMRCCGPDPSAMESCRVIGESAEYMTCLASQRVFEDCMSSVMPPATADDCAPTGEALEPALSCCGLDSTLTFCAPLGAPAVQSCDERDDAYIACVEANGEQACVPRGEERVAVLDCCRDDLVAFEICLSIGEALTYQTCIQLEAEFASCAETKEPADCLRDRSRVRSCCDLDRDLQFCAAL